MAFGIGWPAESENAFDEVARAPGGFEHELEILAGSAFDLRVRQCQVRVAQDGAEDVVEIMGHAAGERADGIHFLCLQHLFFEPGPLRSRPPCGW